MTWVVSTPPAATIVGTHTGDVVEFADIIKEMIFQSAK
jgi:hypothetical protein